MRCAHLGLAIGSLLIVAATDRVKAGTLGTLEPKNFIQSIPAYDSWYEPDLAGPNYKRHPGAWVPPDGFIIGLLAGAVETRDPNASVFAWETSGRDEPGVKWLGVAVQFGTWDFALKTFNAVGTIHQLEFITTDEVVYVPDRGPRRVSASVTPLSAFDLPPGFPLHLNAVRITAPGDWDERLSALAVDPVVPEPGTWILFGSSLLAVSLFRLPHRGRRHKSSV